MAEFGSFERVEKKYLMTAEQYTAFLDRCGDYLTRDEYGEQTILSLYFDTKDYALIRASMETPQPFFKEKFRVRSYGIPSEEDTVFLEIKRKVNGTVAKRRAGMTWYDARRYLSGEWKPNFEDQILKEIDWFRQSYELVPSMLIACERTAFLANDGSGMRLTADRNIRGRKERLLEMADAGRFVFREQMILAEIKVNGAMPLWTAEAFSELGVFHRRFSKYGSLYRQMNGGEI